MLREPMGPYKVGVQCFDTDVIGEEPVKRKLPVMVYYPSDETGPMCMYRSGYNLRELKKTGKANMEIVTHIYENVPLSKKQANYPALIYSHGYTAYMMDNTMLCTDLASNGYIIFNVGHPYGSDTGEYADGTQFENGRNYEGLDVEPTRWELIRMIAGVIPIRSIKRRSASWQTYYEKHATAIRKLLPLWEEDITKILDVIYDDQYPEFLHNKLNLTKGVGLFGMSFGGCNSIGVALKDSRVSCGINFDGALFELNPPVQTEKPLLVVCQRKNVSCYLKLKELHCRNLTICRFDGMTHWQMADGVYLTDKGKNDRAWADKMSIRKSKDCLRFLEKYR